MNIEPFVFEVNEQGVSRKLVSRKLRPQSLKTQTLLLSQKLRHEKYNKSVFAVDRFKTSCLRFVDTMLTYMYNCRQNLRGRGERERPKKTAHSGWITKIIHCIGIVFGLLSNYKPNLSLKMI